MHSVCLLRGLKQQPFRLKLSAAAACDSREQCTYKNLLPEDSVTLQCSALGSTSHKGGNRKYKQSNVQKFIPENGKKSVSEKRSELNIKGSSARVMVLVDRDEMHRTWLSPQKPPLPCLVRVYVDTYCRDCNFRLQATKHQKRI